jgi:MFS family permease
MQEAHDYSPRSAVRFLLIAESFWSLGAGLFFPIFAIFSERVGGDILDAGIAAGIFIFVTSVIEYPIGKYIDKFKEKWFIVADYFLEALVFIGYIFVSNVYELFVLQAILGFANAIGDPAWESMFDKNTPRRGSGSAWANSHLWIGIANAVGIVVGVILVKQFGFDLVFGIGAALSFSAGCIALKYLKR